MGFQHCFRASNWTDAVFNGILNSKYTVHMEATLLSKSVQSNGIQYNPVTFMMPKRFSF